MATVNFTTRANLVAGNPENIADVTDCLDKLQTGVNNVDASNITDGSVGTAELANAAVTYSKWKPDSGLLTATAGGISLSGSPGPWTDVPSLAQAFVPAVASVLLLDFSVTFQLHGVSGGNVWGEARVLLDGVTDTLPHIHVALAGSGTTSISLSPSSAVRIPITAAAHNVKVQVRSEFLDPSCDLTANVNGGYLRWLLHAS
jgi:hypothetical protein